MMPHPSALETPWDEMPATASGKMAFRRRFNRPTGLGAHEIVVLEVDRIVFRGRISLNGETLGELEPGEFFSADITALLMDGNELIAEVIPKSAGREGRRCRTRFTSSTRLSRRGARLGMFGL